MEYIEAISKAIQFCNIKAFKKGLDDLSDYFASNKRTYNLYLEMFRENIRNDYGVLLDKKRETLAEIEWSIRKGFYLQGYTLAESALSAEFITKGIVKCDEEVDAKNKDMAGQHDVNAFLFNEFLMNTRAFQNWLKSDDWQRSQSMIYSNKDNRYSCSNCGKIDMRVEVSFAREDTGVLSLAKSFRSILTEHKAIKNRRNGLVHNNDCELLPPEKYEAAIISYIRKVRKFYNDWSKNAVPILMICSEKEPV